MTEEQRRQALQLRRASEWRIARMVQRCSRAARDLGEFIVWDASDMMCVPGATEDERKEALKLLGQELGIDTSKIIRYVDNDEYRLRK